MNRKFKLARPSRLEWAILIVIGAAIVGVVLWWAVSAFVDSQKTYPLGDKLEYIGKFSTPPCHIGPTAQGFDFGFCTQLTSYYYATDMTKDDVNGYFRKTTIENLPFDGDQVGASGTVFKGVRTHVTSLLMNDSNYVFPVTYSDDINAISQIISAKKTSKKHVVSILASDYKYVLRYAL